MPVSNPPAVGWQMDLEVARLTHPEKVWVWWNDKMEAATPGSSYVGARFSKSPAAAIELLEAWKGDYEVRCVAARFTVWLKNLSGRPPRFYGGSGHTLAEAVCRAVLEAAQEYSKEVPGA